MKARYDFYRNIHKALRRELAYLVADAGCADAASRDEVAAIAGRWQLMRTLLDGHHRHEDVFVGPHLKEIVPALFEEMERDHQGFERELDALSSAASVLADANDRPGATHAFYLDLARFVGRYTVHIDAEERSYMPALQAAYNDQELLAIDGAILASIPPDLMAKYLARMMPAMTPAERVELLGGIKANAPPPAFAGICEIVRASLTPAAWSTLRAEVVGPTTLDAGAPVANGPAANALA